MTDREANGRLNATILDPQRWGWTAASGVADLLTPHERARRSGAKRAFLRSKRKRDSKEGTTASSTPGEERDADSNEPPKRPAHETNQSTESIGDPQQSSSEAATAAGIGALKKPPPDSSSLSAQVETASADTPSVAASAAASAKDDGSSPAIFSALKQPIKGDETADCLDWYTYHRGRTSQERRDEQTGDLLFDLPNPTDTNHHSDEPTWNNAKISVRFPLDDRNRREDGRLDGRKSVFRETIFWDWLGSSSLVVDAETEEGSPPNHIGILEKTPMEIAGAIAQEYGLSFPETIDLAEYIQGQLRTWVQQEALHAPPLTYTDPSTGQRREKPSGSLTELYGNVIGMAEGGFDDKPASGVLQRSFPIPRRLSSVESSKKPGKAKSAANKKETKKPVKADQESIEEVRRRLLIESTEDIKAKCTGEGPVGELKVQRGLSCHICLHMDGSFGQFACGLKGHSFCREHTKHKFGLSFDTEHVALTYCPICSLHCSCDSCTATLEKLAADFKTHNLNQECPIQETKFDGLLLRARTHRVDASKVKHKARSKRKSGNFLSEKMIVQKVPVTDLPREVSEGIDVDPGTDADYAATYTQKGPILPSGLSFSIQPAQANLATKTSFTLEDGSVDFCNVCRNHGNLLCCDFCPRAFHAKCLKASDVDEQSDNPWECPSCSAEKAGLEGDKVDGTQSLEKISSVYVGSKGEAGDENMLLLLGSIHQMLLRLIDYDFGYVFSEPVDTTQFPDYLKTVEKPMDLGTIAKKLLDGSYRESNDESLENIAIKALQDVELVWKNCYRFNVEGSSVYRMALVQERRAKAIREASFSSLLTDNIAASLGYKSTPSEATPKKPAVSIGMQGTVRPQKSRHKITVSKRSHNGRPIAVLDPDTRKIIKIYSTMQAAGAAVVFLLGIGHKCEWHNIEIDTVQKVRKVIKESDHKTWYTLFGYRWLMLDSLRTGRVSFPKDDPTLKKQSALSGDTQKESAGIVRKRDKDGKVSGEFKSVDEAYNDYLSSSYSSTQQNGSIDRKRFQADYLDGKKELKGSFYSAESATDEPGGTASERSDEMEVDGAPSENCEDNPLNCSDKPEVKPKDNAVLDAKDKREGDTTKDAKSDKQESASETDKPSTDKPSLPTMRDGAILTNGSNAASQN